MATLDLARWRAELEAGRQMWMRHGLIGHSDRSTLRELLDFYAGKQWQGGWAGMDSADLQTVNKVYSMVNTSVAQLAARNPQVQVFPRHEEAEAASPRVEALLNYDIESQNMIRQWNRALKDHHFAPLGIVRHGFTPSREFSDADGKRLELYRPIRPDRPWLKRLPIWDVLLDPCAESFHRDGGMRWVAFRDLKPLEWFRRNPAMHKRDGLRPNVSSPFREMRDEEAYGAQPSPYLEDLVEFYWVYEAVERTWFAITLDDAVEKPLRDPEDWPIPWEHLPVNLLGIHERMDSPFPKPLMEEVVPIQKAMNRLRTIMDIVARNTRRVIGVHADVPQTEVDKFLQGVVVEVLRTGQVPIDQALREIKSGGFPQELLLYEQLLEQDLREVKGQSLMDRAQRINVETATEAAGVLQGSQRMASAEALAFEAFVQESVKTYAEGRRSTMTQTELVPILGMQGAAEAVAHLSVSPGDLRHDYDLQIVSGSTLERDLEREAQKAAADLAIGLQTPQFHNLRELLVQYHRLRRNNPARVLVPAEEQRISDAAATMQGRMGEGQPGGLDPQILRGVFGQGGVQ